MGEPTSPRGASGIPAAWTCTGNCGTLGALGVVTASPEGGNYGWIASNAGITGLGLPGIGGTDGTRLRSGVFSANAGDDLEFYFNYVTSDGAGFADYAWVRLQGSDTIYRLIEIAVHRFIASRWSTPCSPKPAVQAAHAQHLVMVLDMV